MELARELGRRLRRGAEARRKFLLPLALVAFFALYLIRYLLGAGSAGGDPARAPPSCPTGRLAPDAVVWTGDEGGPLAHVGNGHLAVALGVADARMRVRRARTLSLPVEFAPVVRVADAGPPATARARALDHSTGTLVAVECRDGYDVVATYYAHRTTPSLFGQEIRIINTVDSTVEVRLRSDGASSWSEAVERTTEVHNGALSHRYVVHTGPVDTGDDDGRVRAVSVAAKVFPTSVLLRPGETITVDAHVVVEYGDPIPRDKYHQSADEVEKRLLRATERIAEVHRDTDPKDSHARAWRKLRTTSFSISESKAAGALNADRIDATVYAVLSQTRALELEDDAAPSIRARVAKALAFAEGCYGGHFTLQADNLWRPIADWARLDAVVGAWLLTLEKQGCHHLLAAGASGVAQAMVLSFGALRFGDRHLEFKMHPEELHRDYHFARLNYGNATRVNISVVVEEDDKAALYVAVEGGGAEGGYYACDAGCLDGPVPLGAARRYFPVKLTQPLTPILYVTSDRRHIEDLRHAIHVKEVAVAPPHERHVLALHKHGNSLGGLPTLFWASICVVIVAFHLFLCRIIMTEYCDPPDRYRRLNSKP